jgi:hypothetical protein
MTDEELTRLVAATAEAIDEATTAALATFGPPSTAPPAA